jgi:Na+/H+ antiporter NhaD/arsenite permease-like protein
VVLLVAPVALSLAAKLKTSPVPLLIGIAVSSNLQGTATMIGDPPSMILAGYMRMGFLDFFVYHGRPGIFFAVQVGAVLSLLVLAWLFRGHREPAATVSVEEVRSWFPALLLTILILGLSVSTLFDPEFGWFAGVLTMLLAAGGAFWFRYASRWGGWRGLASSLDWDTTFFLAGIFILVGALGDSGWLTRLADVLSSAVGGRLPVAFAVIVLFSVIVSGFVDNVPFLLAMIPVVQQVSGKIQAPETPLMFGLLIGACLGGNLTPIGASANVVALGILKKRGHVVSFREFARVGVPFTVAAVLGACLFVWLVWAP